MRTSPSLGRSRPAIRRSSVVLPQPDGPRRTRYSPSPVTRSMPLTATVSPNSFRSALVSTLACRTGYRRLRRGLPLRRAGHHCGKYVRGEDLADRRVRRSWVPNIRAPLLSAGEQRELVRRMGSEWVAREPAWQRRRGGGVREGREVVQLGVVHGIVGRADQAYQELLDLVH